MNPTARAGPSFAVGPVVERVPGVQDGVPKLDGVGEDTREFLLEALEAFDEGIVCHAESICTKGAALKRVGTHGVAK
jgi:hypothetical protein